MVRCGVLFEVRTDLLNITQTMLGFKWLNNYLKITDIVNNVFGPKKTRIKLYNILALPNLLYGSKNWTVKARNATRITATQIKYMRITAGYTLLTITFSN
jgi:hypothetical protein